MSHLDEFTRGYIEAAIWSSTDEDGNPLDRNYGESDLDSASLTSMKRDCASFVRRHKRDLEAFVEVARGGRSDDGPWSLAGYCFWMNRNGHGVGFWDRDAGAVGDKLSDACKKFGSSDLYVGDDGQLHVSPIRGAVRKYKLKKKRRAKRKKVAGRRRITRRRRKKGRK